MAGTLNFEGKNEMIVQNAVFMENELPVFIALKTLVLSINWKLSHVRCYRMVRLVPIMSVR